MDSCTKKEDGHSIVKSKTPHFFKIILNDAIRDGKLLIPRKFVRMYGNELSGSVVLRVPGGAKWKIELMKCDDKIWFHHGWQEFQKFYFLSHGSLLVFQYDKNQDFNVIIFDKSASEISYPFINPEKEENPQVQNTGNSNSDVSVEILSHLSESSKTKKRSPLPFVQASKKIKLELLDNSSGQARANIENRDGVVTETPPLTAEEKPDVLNTATANYESENPFFRVTMQGTYVNHPFALNVPVSFVKKYFNKRCRNLVLRNIDGKTWPITYHFYTHKSETAKFCCGWRAFVRENRLKTGDICIFELINDSKLITLEVLICRRTGNANTKPSLGNIKQPKNKKGSRDDKRVAKQGASSKASGTTRAANAFTSVNPFFRVAINSTKCPKIPKEFVRKYAKKTRNAILQMGSRRWPLKIKGYLSSGWPLFAKENNLQHGDVCIFELIDSDFLLLKVSIFRNVK